MRGSRGEDAVDVGVHLRRRRRLSAAAGRDRWRRRAAAAGVVVTSLLSWLITSWNLATGTMTPPSSASRRRPGVTSMILALPWMPVENNAGLRDPR